MGLAVGRRPRDAEILLNEWIQQGRKSGKWLKVEIIAVKGSMSVVNTGATIFQANISKPRRPSDTGFGRTSGFA